MTDRGESSTDQKKHWEQTYSNNPSFFGEEPSEFAAAAVAVFSREGVRTVLELGCGHGRDTLLFAREGFEVTALDYSEEALGILAARAGEIGVSSHVARRVFDVREALPFPSGSFDACYSHMLLCMELSTPELEFILGEIHRVLRPGGLTLYSVRNTDDKHYRTGIHRSEDMYEIGGFVVHFFSQEMIRSLSRGYKILEVNRMQEGSIPRELFAVALRKNEDLLSDDPRQGTAREATPDEHAAAPSKDPTPQDPGKT
ncbi:MAG TPA: class I SAM-dependent methyltransferase [Geobacteraceae bacterium]|jgi:SAM-dependent methyltransferase|nr:class I SAM-dependent methyltransferase [Geobacteraceae bacterium]